MMSFHPTLPQIVTYILCCVTLGNPIRGATMYTVSPWDPPASTAFVTHNQQAAEQTMDTHPTLGNNKLRHHFKKQKMRRKKWMKKILTLPMHLSRSENFLIFMINCFVSLLFFRCTLGKPIYRALWQSWRFSNPTHGKSTPRYTS